MEVQSLRCFTLCVLLMSALVSGGANPINHNEKQMQKQIIESGDVGEAKLQSLKHSPMAERSGDALNEHAVDNPEEIASMVDIRGLT